MTQNHPLPGSIPGGVTDTLEGSIDLLRSYNNVDAMEMILFEEKNLLDITRDTLEKFGDANLESKAARKAIAQKIRDELRKESETISGENYFSSHEN